MLNESSKTQKVTYRQIDGDRKCISDCQGLGERKYRSKKIFQEYTDSIEDIVSAFSTRLSLFTNCKNLQLLHELPAGCWGVFVLEAEQARAETLGVKAPFSSSQPALIN